MIRGVSPVDAKGFSVCIKRLFLLLI